MDVGLRIRNGIVHSSGGSLHADILIAGERIVGLISPDQPCNAQTEIDAAGKDILPGVVDLHAHTRSPGYEYKEDFTTCSQAAAVGGITTFVDMPNVEPPTDDVQKFEAKRDLAASQCVIDWGHLVAPTRFDQIEGLAAAGATGFKVFQVSGGYPHDPRLALGETERIYQAFELVARTGLHCSVHPFNQPLMDYLTAAAAAAGRRLDASLFAEVYTSDLVWRSAVAVLLELQRETSVRLHLLHTHAAGSLRAIRHAKQQGLRVTCAVDPKYYHLSREDVDAQGPRAAPGGVITEDEDRMSEIWRSLNDGTLDMIDSDHAPHTLEDLEEFSRDPWSGPFGSPQYEYILSLLLTDVHSGRLPLRTLVRLVCENPARLIGRYPQKGAIQVGSDADLVIVDLSKPVEPADSATYTKVGWTPYAGWKLVGSPVTTILRGTIIAHEGKVIGSPGGGKYLYGVPQDPVRPQKTWYSPGLAYEPRAEREEQASVAQEVLWRLPERRYEYRK
jgi:dihydroorotase